MTKFDPKNPGGSVDIFLTAAKDQVKTIQVPAVIDLDSENDIIGCEIINLKFVAGKSSTDFLQQLPAAPGRFPRFSYDPQVDACYLQLKGGTAANTESVDVTAGIDSHGRIIRLSI